MGLVLVLNMGFAVGLSGIRVKVVWVGFWNVIGIVVCVGFGIECGDGLLLGIWDGIGAQVDFGVGKKLVLSLGL